MAKRGTQFPGVACGSRFTSDNIEVGSQLFNMHVTAIIAAGGRGQRFGGTEPKQLLAIGGRPILERSVTAFASHPAVGALIVALPQALADDPPA